MSRRDKIYLGTNTKTYKTIAQTEEFLYTLSTLTRDIPRDLLELFVIPSYTALDAARKSVLDDNIILGAQNMGWDEEGPLTGEISPLQLKDAGVRVVCVGHSERRHMLGETDIMVNKKMRCASHYNFMPLLCIGETGEQKRLGIADEVLGTQLKMGLDGITAEQAGQILVAYEPVWAIGDKGVPAEADYADERHRFIKETLINIFGTECGGDIPVLHGGSVNMGNAQELLQSDAVDGLFIGRSAWDANKFNDIIRNILPRFSARKRAMRAK